MSYQNRRGPNVSQYIANLNAINPPISEVQSPELEEVAIVDDLASFTNTTFFDFDMGEPLPNNNMSNSTDRAFGQKTGTKTEKDEYDDFGSLLNGDFNNFELLPMLQDDSFNVNFQADGTTSHQPSTQSPEDSTSSGVKRKASSDLSSPRDKHFNMEDASRMAAEEDKRRRNTAASARFRIKKKQREQAMEQHAKELEQKCQSLEARVSQLEMENKWLKNLVVEKNNAPTTRDDKTSSTTSTKEGTDGVGTKLQK